MVDIGRESTSFYDSTRVFYWEPPLTGKDYSWDCLGALMCQAEILYHSGYPTAYSASNQQLLRAADFLDRAGNQIHYTQQLFVPWMVNYHYGTGYPTQSLAGKSLNWGVFWTDWTHQRPGVAAAPSAPTSLSASSALDGLSATVSFSTQGTDITEYDLRISYQIPPDFNTQTAEEDFFGLARVTQGVPTPSNCDSTESFTLSNLCPGRIYYLVVKAKNAIGYSPMSNVFMLETDGSEDPECAEVIE
jgi:hypothetical protein